MCFPSRRLQVASFAVFRVIARGFEPWLLGRPSAPVIVSIRLGMVTAPNGEKSYADHPGRSELWVGHELRTILIHGQDVLWRDVGLEQMGEP